MTETKTETGLPEEVVDKHNKLLDDVEAHLADAREALETTSNEVGDAISNLEELIELTDSALDDVDPDDDRELHTDLEDRLAKYRSVLKDLNECPLPDESVIPSDLEVAGIGG